MAGIKIKIDPVDKILLKRNLNQNGQAQKLFSSEVRRMSDPYVPFQKGDVYKRQLINYLLLLRVAVKGCGLEEPREA